MIGFGDYFVSDRTEDFGLIIYGYVLTEAELLEKEDESTMGLLLTNYAQGVRFSKCYSVDCVEGEYGNVNMNMCERITKQQFEEARKRGWSPYPAGKN